MTEGIIQEVFRDWDASIPTNRCFQGRDIELLKQKLIEKIKQKSNIDLSIGCKAITLDRLLGDNQE